jgi:hypothetical protein
MPVSGLKPPITPDIRGHAAGGRSGELGSTEPNGQLVRVIPFTLHTREVAGSKPAAPIKTFASIQANLGYPSRKLHMGQCGAVGQIVGQNRTFRAAAVSQKLVFIPVNRMSTAPRRVAVAATRLVVGQVFGLPTRILQPLWLAASAEEREFRTIERPSRQRQLTDSDADALYHRPSCRVETSDEAFEQVIRRARDRRGGKPLPSPRGHGRPTSPDNRRPRPATPCARTPPMHVSDAQVARHHQRRDAAVTRSRASAS